MASGNKIHGTHLIQNPVLPFINEHNAKVHNTRFYTSESSAIEIKSVDGYNVNDYIVTLEKITDTSSVLFI